MNLEFKFNNDVYASVDFLQKIVYPYTKEQYGEGFVCIPLSFNNDNELVDALKKVSERKNLNQHREVVDIVYDHFKGADISRDTDGALMVNASSDEVDVFDKGFMADMESCGCLYWFDNDQPEQFFVSYKGVRIIEIRYDGN